MADETLFISDCHLDRGQPEVIEGLTRFLRLRATGARSLYILGDLFEVWLGDDAAVSLYQPVIDALKDLSQATDLFFIAGNRDFLLGDSFAANCGMTRLSEPRFLQLGSSTAVLIHGDSLCTDDHDYQEFRSMVRSPEWQTDFLAKPLIERQQIAEQLRDASVDAMSRKSMQIMDVNPDAVLNCFSEHNVDTIIHGHTHRPAIHQYPSARQRIVLGDWRPAESYLSWTPDRGFVLTDSRI